MGYILPIHIGKLIIQNVQYWQKTQFFFNEIFQNHFKESLFEDVIYEIFSSGISESIKSTFAMWINLK